MRSSGPPWLRRSCGRCELLPKRSRLPRLADSVALRPSITAVEGAISARVPDRNPTGTIVVEDTLVSEFDWRGKEKAATTIEFEISVGSVGPSRARCLEQLRREYAGVCRRAGRDKRLHAAGEDR